MSYPARVALWLCVLGSLVACGCRGASADKKQSRTFQVEPGKFAEVNVRMVKGTRVVATFKASAPVDWNTHSHPSGKTVIHSQGKDQAGTASITAEKRNTYSLLWENKTDKKVTLEVTLDLPRGTEVDSWVGHD